MINWKDEKKTSWNSTSLLFHSSSFLKKERKKEFSKDYKNIFDKNRFYFDKKNIFKRRRSVYKWDEYIDWLF